MNDLLIFQNGRLQLMQEEAAAVVPSMAELIILIGM